MSATMRTPIAPVGWSIALHAVLAGLLFLGLTLPERDTEPVILPIDAVVVDDAVRDRRERAAGLLIRQHGHAELDLRLHVAADLLAAKLPDRLLDGLLPRLVHQRHALVRVLDRQRHLDPLDRHALDLQARLHLRQDRLRRGADRVRRDLR